MKSTQSTTYRSLNNELGKINNSLETLRNQAATGKKLLRPSDDPAAIRPVLSARTQIRATDRFISSLSTAGDRLANQDSYLDQAENLLVSAKETAISAINGAMSDADLTTLADQIGYLKTQMLSVANAQVGGQYIFAGFQEDTAPFVEDGDTVIYQGDSNIKKLESSPGEYVQTNLDGAKLFLGMSDTDGDGVLEQTGMNVFEQLTNLERAIRGTDVHIYNGDTALPSSDIGYLDEVGGNYTPVALDVSGEQLLDSSGEAVSLTFDGEPISLFPLVGIDGQPVTIEEYYASLTPPPAVVNDYNAIPLSASALEQPMYVYNDGSSPVDFNTHGEPVMPYDGTVVTGLTSDTYVATPPAQVSVTGAPMDDPTVGGGDVTINGNNVAASTSAIELAENIVTASGGSVTATAADSSTGADLNAWTDVTALDGAFSLTVGGVDLFVSDGDGVSAADINDAIATATESTPPGVLFIAGISASGLVPDDLVFTKADGSNIDIQQTIGSGGTEKGFTTIADDGAIETYYGVVTISSYSDFTLGGSSSTSLLSGGEPLQMSVPPTLNDLLATLEKTADQTRSARGLMGNNAERIDTSRSHLEGVLVDLAQILSRYEDVDIIDVITEITQTETALEAALSVTGKVSRLSIMDYL